MPLPQHRNALCLSFLVISFNSQYSSSTYAEFWFGKLVTLYQLAVQGGKIGRL